MGNFINVENIQEKQSLATQNLLKLIKSEILNDSQPENLYDLFEICKSNSSVTDENNTFSIRQFPNLNSNIPYVKYVYRHIAILEMIMMNPNFFVALTDEGVEILYQGLISKKLYINIFGKIKENNNSEIRYKKLTKFNEDIFYLTFIIESKNKFNVSKNFQIIIFSVTECMKQGKIVPIYNLNKIDNAFLINEHELFTLKKGSIYIIDINKNQILFQDENQTLLNYHIANSFFLSENLVLFVSNLLNKSIIYNLSKRAIEMIINDKITITFNLCKTKAILLGNKHKELLFLDSLKGINLDQYETDFLSSIENKVFFPLCEDKFLCINKINSKIKEILIQPNYNFIQINEKMCPKELINFCPLVEKTNDMNIIYCCLFICDDQTYILKDQNLSDVDFNNQEVKFNGINRLFLSYFETEQIIGYDIIPFAVIQNQGGAYIKFGKLKNKKIQENNLLFNYFSPDTCLELINGSFLGENAVYVLCIVKNLYIYVAKFSNKEQNDFYVKYNFGNIKTKGITNLMNNKAFVYINNTAFTFNVREFFNNKVLVKDKIFKFDFNVYYSYYLKDNLIILVNNKFMVLYDLVKQKSIKELKFNFTLSEENDINIRKFNDNLYCLISDKNLLIFNISNFTCVNNIKSLKNYSILGFQSLTDSFIVNKISLANSTAIYNFKEETDDQKHKLKYLNDGSIFVGVYPNKFFIFNNH